MVYLSLMWSKETSNIRIEIQDQQLMGSYKVLAYIKKYQFPNSTNRSTILSISQPINESMDG